MHKISRLGLILAASLLICTNAFAQKINGNIAVLIASTHYQHPVRLLHPYIDFWHMKGPMAEKVAFKMLDKRIDNLKLCKNSTNVDAVLMLEPHMFYNAQLNVYHAEFIARVFTKTIEPILTIKKQAQQIGPLTIKPDFYMEKAYTKALEKVINKLETDPTLISALANSKGNNAETLCPALDNLPLSKIYY